VPLQDVEDLHRQRVEGRIDLTTVGQVLEAATEVTELLNAGTQWWKPRETWSPGPQP
jgi:hypothetical protein